jgi:multidrug efflux pump
VLSSIYWLYSNSKNELAPLEDQGDILTQSTLAPNVTLQQKLLYSAEVYRRFAAHSETAGVFQLDVVGSSIAGSVLKPWGKREKNAAELQPVVQAEMAGIAGARIVAFQQPPLPGSSGLPIQFVILTKDPFDRLDGVAKAFTAEALNSGKFIFLDNDLKIDPRQTSVMIDLEKAAQRGLKLSDVGGALGTVLDGRSYKVIPQVEQRYRLNADQVLDCYTKTSNGTAIPLSMLISLKTTTVPESLSHFQQVNAATISGMTAPGVITGEALATLKEIADRTLPKGYTVYYAGQSRQFIQESSDFITTFGFALIIIFLALSAQFESFRDPLIILVSVPMSIAGALVFIMLGVKSASLNIYTEVGARGDSRAS